MKRLKKGVGAQAKKSVVGDVTKKSAGVQKKVVKAVAKKRGAKGTSKAPATKVVKQKLSAKKSTAKGFSKQKRKKGRGCKSLVKQFFTKLSKVRKNVVKKQKKLKQKLTKSWARKNKRLCKEVKKLTKRINGKIKNNIWTSFFVHTVIVAGIGYSVTDNFSVKADHDKYSTIISNLEKEIDDIKFLKRSNQVQALRSTLQKLKAENAKLLAEYRKLETKRMSTTPLKHEAKVDEPVCVQKEEVVAKGLAENKTTSRTQIENNKKLLPSSKSLSMDVKIAKELTKKLENKNTSTVIKAESEDAVITKTKLGLTKNLNDFMSQAFKKSVQTKNDIKKIKTASVNFAKEVARLEDSSLNVKENLLEVELKKPVVTSAVKKVATKITKLTKPESKNIVEKLFSAAKSKVKIAAETHSLSSSTSEVEAKIEDIPEVVAKTNVVPEVEAKIEDISDVVAKTNGVPKQKHEIKEFVRATIVETPKEASKVEIAKMPVERIRPKILLNVKGKLIEKTANVPKLSEDIKLITTAKIHETSKLKPLIKATPTIDKHAKTEISINSKLISALNKETSQIARLNEITKNSEIIREAANVNFAKVKIEKEPKTTKEDKFVKASQAVKASQTVKAKAPKLTKKLHSLHLKISQEQVNIRKLDRKISVLNKQCAQSNKLNSAKCRAFENSQTELKKLKKRVSLMQARKKRLKAKISKITN